MPTKLSHQEPRQTLTSRPMALTSNKVQRGKTQQPDEGVLASLQLEDGETPTERVPRTRIQAKPITAPNPHLTFLNGAGFVLWLTVALCIQLRRDLNSPCLAAHAPSPSQESKNPRLHSSSPVDGKLNANRTL